jgi:hypothetical protein
VQTATALGEDDPRYLPLLAAAATHLGGSLEPATQGDYMITHWVPAFALLALS